MNSAERILHYASEIEQEAPHRLPNHKPSLEWPQAGQINIENISVRYRPSLPLVLRNVSLSIRGGEKVGIVSR